MRAPTAPRDGILGDDQVLLDREVDEHVAALANVRHAGARELVRRTVADVGAEKPDAARRDPAVFERQDAGRSLQRGRLAGSVRAEQRDNAAGRHLDRQATQRLDAVIVDDLDVLDGQRGGPALGAGPFRDMSPVITPSATGRQAPSSSCQGRSCTCGRPGSGACCNRRAGPMMPPVSQSRDALQRSLHAWQVERLAGLQQRSAISAKIMPENQVVDVERRDVLHLRPVLGEVLAHAVDHRAVGLVAVAVHADAGELHAERAEAVVGRLGRGPRRCP